MILGPSGMFLSFKIGIGFVFAAVVCVILERISGLGPSPERTYPRRLKLLTVSRFSSQTRNFLICALKATVVEMSTSATIVSP